MKNLRKFLAENKSLLAIFLAAFVLRLIFLSPWLEDWDSVQFALALDEFSLAKHQPHSPGYPLYILPGRLLNSIFKNPTFSLTFLSALMGSLSVVPFYLLTKKMADKKTALLASLVFITLPVHWVLSEIAVSNITGLFFVITTAYLIYRELFSPRKKSLVGFYSGLFLGVRPTDLPIFAGLLTFLFFKKKKFLYRLYLVLGFLIGIFLWLIPLIAITGSAEFSSISSETSKYFIWHDMLFGKPFDFWTYLNDRLFNLIKLLKIGYTPLFFTISIVSIVITMAKRNLIKPVTHQFLLVYLISYGVPLVLLYNLELAQYTLPLSLVFVIFAVLFLKNKFSANVFTAGCLILFGLLFRTSFSLVNHQAKVLPPSIAPVLFVKTNYDEKDALLITTYTFRQFQYYAPEYRNFYGVANAPKEIDSQFVVIDYQDLAIQIPALSNYNITAEKHFGPSQNKFVRLRETNLYILEKKPTSLHPKPHSDSFEI